jgi:catechol 2,3-dioxygenase-like lactoylglutathione lyase family enzyme
MGSFTSVDHLIIAVRDLDEAEKAYNQIFGRSPSWKGTHPGMGSANILYRLANTYVELLGPSGEGPNGDMLRAHLDEKGEGMFGVVFGTDDAAARIASLREKGVPAGDPVDGSGRDGMTGAERRWRTFGLPRETMRGLFSFGIQHLSEADALPPAPLLEGVSEAQAVSSCDHVVVMTPDAEACKELYGDKFGIRLALDHTKPEWGVRQLFFRLGGLTLEVVEPLDKAKAPKADHYWGVAWKVEDAAGAAARMEKAGLDVSEVRKGRKPGSEVATIRKPTCGVPTLLISQGAA